MKMRYLPIALSLMFGPVMVAQAQISVEIGLPGVNIGINMPMYPQLVQVPGYPVYYAPGASANYFFYDGDYWVYQRDNWYASTWYNGPWQAVDPEYVPQFVLRIPVRYYREPPAYFRSWSRNDAPRWGEHWGQSWSSQHKGWDQWNRNSVPTAAPLPVYQRQYSGTRYPRTVAQQSSIRTENYHYQPREAVTRQIQQHGSASSRVATQTEQRTQAHQAQTLQHTQMQQRAQAQQTEKRAQAQRAQASQHTQTQQRAQVQQTEKRAQAQRAQASQHTQTQQRAQVQQTEKRAQAQRAQALQHTQTQQRAQAQQTEKPAQRAQTLQREQTQQHARVQQTEKRANAQRAQTVKRAPTQQNVQARQPDQRAQAQRAKQPEPRSAQRAKAAPKGKDKKDQDQTQDHSGG